MRICALILVILQLISFAGCSLILESTSGWEKHMFGSVTSSSKELSDNILQELCATISGEDVETLYLLFSPNAVRSCPEFDKRVTDLLEFWEGNIVSTKRYGPHTKAKKDGKLYRKEVFVSYDVSTDKASYRLAFLFCVSDSSDSRNIGITSLYITKQDDFNPDRAYRSNSEEWAYGINIE